MRRGQVDNVETAQHWVTAGAGHGSDGAGHIHLEDAVEDRHSARQCRGIVTVQGAMQFHLDNG